ncbi:MAG: hypothetical protein MUC42_01520 [Bryobacter sp.]|nr:hypothetical protein [Bryobacter sp.]
MHSFRQYSLTTLILVCGWMGGIPLFPQQPPAPPKPKPASPFESVPQAVPEAPKPQAPKMEAPKPAEEQVAGPIQDIVELIEFRGARRVPQDTLRALIFKHRH